MAPVILLGLLLSACGGSNDQLADKSGNTGQSTHVESIDQEEKEIPVPDSSIVENRDGLTFPIGNAVTFPGAFTGTAYLATMIASDEIYHFPQTNHVTFEPGQEATGTAMEGWLFWLPEVSDIIRKKESQPRSSGRAM